MNKNLETAIKELIEAAETDKQLIQQLKSLAISTSHYGLGAKFRDIEFELFPETNKHKKTIKETEVFRVGLRLVDVDINDKLAYKILSVARVFIKKGGKMDMEDTAKILAKTTEIFGE